MCMYVCVSNLEQAMRENSLKTDEKRKFVANG